MDIYDVRRENLLALIKQLNLSYAAFGALVGYKGAYIGQLVNRTKRSSGGQAIVSDKVVTKILSKVKAKAPDVTREWFDQAHDLIARLNDMIEKGPPPIRQEDVDASYKEYLAKNPPPDLSLVDDERFPDHLQSTWPYMSEEQRNAIRYLEAGFRATRKNKQPSK